MSTDDKKYKYDYKKIKQDISLPNFVRDILGWKPDDGYSTNYPKFKSPEGDKVIIISMGSQGYHTYFDARDSSLSGGKSVFDLFQEYHKNATGKDIKLPEVAKLLQSYIDQGKTIHPKYCEFSIEQKLHDPAYVANVIRGCKAVTESDFLTNRGIDLEILKEKGWSNVFLERIRNNRDKTKLDGQEFSFKNICVRMFNTEGIQALSERNEKFKGIEGGRADCIASSTVLDRTKPIEKIHLFESMIDAVSYYQMNYFNTPHKDDNVIFISSEGALTNAQLSTIQNAIEKFNVQKIELNFDNDIAGLKYSLNAVASLQLVDQNGGDIRFSSVSERASNNDSLIFVNAIVREKDQNNALKIIDTVFAKGIMDDYYEKNRYAISHTHTSADPLEQHYAISFPKNKELLKDIVTNFIEYKFGKNVELKLPQTKDYNDDLKLSNSTKEKELTTGKNINQITM